MLDYSMPPGQSIYCAFHQMWNLAQAHQQPVRTVTPEQIEIIIRPEDDWEAVVEEYVNNTTASTI